MTPRAGDGGPRPRVGRASPRCVPILAAHTGWHTDELHRAFAARGVHAPVIPYESLRACIGGRPRLAAGDVDLLAADAVLARIIPAGSLEQIIYRVDALHWLEDRGIPVVNSPRTIERTVDKFYTSTLLQQSGIPTPDTVVCERIDDAIPAFREMRDVIVKPLFGSMGLGMVRVTDEDTAWRVFRALDAIRSVYYLQRTVAHSGRDVRAFVIGGRIVGAIERSAPGWRTNLARGGRARPVDLTTAWESLALDAARAVGADYAGVDLLPADDGTLYVLEVNGIPGWHGLQTATALDIATLLADHLIDVRLARH